MADFDDVKLYEDADAAQLGAEAYTGGGDPYFAADGGADPMAHELSHVVQQGDASVDTYERESEEG